MVNPTNDKSIKDTLNIIRKAINEKNISLDESNKDVLILNQLIKNDGTITTIKDSNLEKDEVKKILDDKISQIVETYFDNWLKENAHSYLEKYFSKKEK